MKDGKFEIEDIKLSKLSREFDLSKFDCGDPDLNEFLKEDSFEYRDNKITSTILVIYNERVVGFFSICNDAIKLKLDEKSGCGLNKKPLQEYPAVKIARLAVDLSCQKKNLGTTILKMAIGYIINEISNKVGCRFITVDSYQDKINFYKKFNFIINEHSKYIKKEEYVSMRFDLLNPPKNK